jgi:hypothetical protein
MVIEGVPLLATFLAWAEHERGASIGQVVSLPLMGCGSSRIPSSEAYRMPDPISRLSFAAGEIDRVFGEGYAVAHPEVVAAVMLSAWEGPGRVNCRRDRTRSGSARAGAENWHRNWHRTATGQLSPLCS